MEKQKPHQNVFKGLGDDWCNLSGSAWPNQRGTDGRHVELNSYAKHKYVNINKRIKTKGNRKQPGKGEHEPTDPSSGHSAVGDITSSLTHASMACKDNSSNSWRAQRKTSKT